MNVTHARLSNQLLDTNKCNKPADVVAWLGAVQAQDFAAAKWALGLRTRKSTEAEVERAFNYGEILRTHVMRPTWHFVAPQNIRSLLALTAVRVHTANGYAYRKFELDARLLHRCHRVLTRALRDNNYLTRSELASRLSQNRIEASGTRLAYIVAHAELEALICSGPRRGKQHTYALLEERVPPTIVLDPEESLAQWTVRFFTSHGPAQLIDFSWWSGLTLKDARRGVDLAASLLVSETIDGKTYWFSPNSKITERLSSAAHLLSIYDEYTIAYKDRSALSDERYIERLLAMGNALTSVVILNGKIAGTWKRVFNKGQVEIVTNLFRPLKKYEREALTATAVGYGKFLEMPVQLSTETKQK